MWAVEKSLEWKHSVWRRKMKAKLNCIDIISGGQGSYEPSRETWIQQFTLIFHCCHVNIFFNKCMQTVTQLSLNIPNLISQSTHDRCVKAGPLMGLSACFCSPSTCMCFMALWGARAFIRQSLRARWHIHARPLMNQTPSVLASPMLSWGSPWTARTLS